MVSVFGFPGSRLRVQGSGLRVQGFWARGFGSLWVGADPSLCGHWGSSSNSEILGRRRTRKSSEDVNSQTVKPTALPRPLEAQVRFETSPHISSPWSPPPLLHDPPSSTKHFTENSSLLMAARTVANPKLDETSSSCPFLAQQLPRRRCPI